VCLCVCVCLFVCLFVCVCVCACEGVEEAIFNGQASVLKRDVKLMAIINIILSL
jgi:hypothetical protein